MRRIYLDYAATTPLDPRVKRAMEPWWDMEYGNAGGLYEEGRRAKEAMQSSRETIAKLIGAKADEIIFTSGGTEADNLAIFGIASSFAKASEDKRGHIITTAFEHHAVLNPCQQLGKEGFEVTYLNVGKDGIVNPEEVRKALRPETILVSIIYANNEIGTIQPIAEIGKIIRDYKSRRKVGTPTVASGLPYFHTDACQASGYLDLNVNNLGVDLMSVNGSKIYGPKGVGFLYKRLGVKIKPQILGGGQEGRMRSGTEAIPLVVGMGEAFKIAQEERDGETKRLAPLRDYFIAEVIKRIPKVVLNGDAQRRLPNNINVSILDIEGEALILYLDAEGISISTGSACTSESLDPSHVILALGKPYEFAHSSMRFTLGRATDKEALDYVLEKLPKVVEWLRVVSPLNLDPDATSMSHPEAFAGENLKVKAKSKSYK
ncbi:MAG: cysteine desulfurase family protein [bacterium]|nr:cysteine desulfurase family protein [bacterium]